VEIYTGLIYEGPEIVGEICRELKALLDRDGFSHISQAVGTAHRR
jgi:dihydroorotate dehydrogenase